VDIKNTDLMLIMGGNRRRTSLRIQWAIEASALETQKYCGDLVHANGERGG